MKHLEKEAFMQQSVAAYLITIKRIRVLTYADISNRLEAMGVVQSPANLSNKFKSGKLNAALFCALLIAMGEEGIDFAEFSNANPDGDQ